MLTPVRCKSARLPKFAGGTTFGKLASNNKLQLSQTYRVVVVVVGCPTSSHAPARTAALTTRFLDISFFFSLYLMLCPGGSALLCNGRRVKSAQQVSGLVHNSSFHFFLHSFSADPLFMFSWFTVCLSLSHTRRLFLSPLPPSHILFCIPVHCILSGIHRILSRDKE